MNLFIYNQKKFKLLIIRLKNFYIQKKKEKNIFNKMIKKFSNEDSSLSKKFADLDLRHDLNKLMKQSNELNILNDIKLTNLNLKKIKSR